MAAIAILLAAAAVGFGLARALRLPSLPLLLLAGTLTDVFVELPVELLSDTVVLGTAFLVFVAGVELNPGRVGGQRRAALRVGIVQFAGLGAVGLTLALALGFDVTAAFYIALALTASSTLVVVRLLQQRGQMFEPFGRLVLGVLLLQDLFVILLTPVVTRLTGDITTMFVGIGAAIGLTALAFVCYRYLTRPALKRLEDDPETLLLVVLGTLFIFVGLAALFDLPVLAGAFLAGFALSPFPVNGIVRAEFGPISDFFLAVLFTALGALLTRPSGDALLAAFVLAAAVIFVTPPLVAFLAERAGLSARAGIESGLLLAQTSEFSLVIGLLGMVEGHIGQDVFTVIALVTVFTMILTPFLGTDRMTWWLMRLHPMRARRAPEEPPRDHILLLGCGEAGWPLLETLMASGHDVLVIDDDAAIISRLRDGEIPALRGDGSDYDVLHKAGAARARLIISTIRRAADNEAVLRCAPNVPALVRVFDEPAAERIRSLGGTPILSAEAAAEDFVRWYEQASEVGIENERRKRPRDYDGEL